LHVFVIAFFFLSKFHWHLCLQQALTVLWICFPASAWMLYGCVDCSLC
jgi:hypothetical protein